MKLKKHEMIFPKIPKCPYCAEKCDYNQYHDCHFCKGCDIWTEKTCDDPDCYYCPGRPEKPSQFNYRDFLDIR